MAKYKPIELSEKYVESVTNDENGKETSTTVFNGINQIALFLGVDIGIQKEQFILELLKVASKKNISKVDDSVKNMLVEFSKAQKEQGANVTPVDMVDMFLIPLAFEIWQRDKVVVNIEEGVTDFIKHGYPCPASSNAIKNLPQVFWINPVKTLQRSEDTLGTLILTYVNEKPIKDEDDTDKLISDIYIAGWSFSSIDSNKFTSHMTSFNLTEYEDSLGFININPKGTMDSNFIYYVCSYLGLGLFSKEMTDISKATYKVPNPSVKPKNRFNEVREYDIHVSDDLENEILKAKMPRAVTSEIE